MGTVLGADRIPLPSQDSWAPSFLSLAAHQDAPLGRRCLAAPASTLGVPRLKKPKGIVPRARLSLHP